MSTLMQPELFRRHLSRVLQIPNSTPISNSNVATRELSTPLGIIG